MTSANSPVIKITRRFEASAERVFDAWLDPRRARKFLYATPGGRMTRMEIDARVGGRYAIVEQRGEQAAGHFGKYLEIDRPRRLVFTFGADEGDDGGDVVSIEIVPLDQGCELTLVHTMSPEWAEYAKKVEEGWGMVVGNIVRALE